MAKELVLLVVAVWASSALALSEVEQCASKGDKLMQKRFAPARVERQDFKNTTPGSYNQEYMGTYSVSGRRVVAEFYSPFICDSLSLTSVSH